MTQSDLTELRPAPDRKEKTKKPPYKLYAGVIALIVVARLLDLATQHMEWTVWVYGQTWIWCVLALLAVAFGYVCAPRLRTNTPAIMAILICSLVGGVINIVTNSTVGMLGGFLGASFSAFESLHNATQRVLVTRALPLGLAAAAAGIAAAFSIVLTSPRTDTSDLVCVLTPLVLGLVALFAWTRWRRSSQRSDGSVERTSWSRVFVGLVLTWPLTFLLYLIASAAVFFLALTWELDRRDRLMEHVGVGSSYVEFLTPFAATQFQLQVAESIQVGYMDFNRGMLDFGASGDADEIARTRGFPWLRDIVVRSGSALTDEQFAVLDKRNLQSLNVFDDTRLTDKSIQSLNFSSLQYLTLEGPNFGDAAIANLSQARSLWQLNLRDTNVTSAGVKKLHPLAPVWNVDLRRTAVDDGIVTYLAKRGIQVMALRGTNVTGATLKDLRGLRVSLLDLSDTKLDPKYLADLLPVAKGQNLLTKTIVGQLDVSNVALTSEDVTTVSKIAGLKTLSIPGSGVESESIAVLANIPTLQWLTMDADLLSDEALESVPTTVELKLVFDGEQSPEEIVAIASRIRQQRRDVSELVVEGFSVTEDSVPGMLSIFDGEFNIRFRNAKLRDGALRDFSHHSTFIEYAKEQWPDIVKDTREKQRTNGRQ